MNNIEKRKTNGKDGSYSSRSTVPGLGRLGRLMSIGIEFTASIVIGLAGGLWADSIFNSKPVGMFAGLGLGIIAAFRTLIRLAINLKKGDA